MSGWIALSFLNNPNLALRHFKNFYGNVGYPISLAREGLTGLELLMKKIGNKKLANDFFKEGSKFLTKRFMANYLFKNRSFR